MHLLETRVLVVALVISTRLGTHSAWPTPFTTLMMHRYARPARPRLAREEQHREDNADQRPNENGDIEMSPKQCRRRHIDVVSTSFQPHFELGS